MCKLSIQNTKICYLKDLGFKKKPPSHRMIYCANKCRTDPVFFLESPQKPYKCSKIPMEHDRLILKFSCWKSRGFT